jgi:hypothetical protein
MAADPPGALGGLLAAAGRETSRLMDAFNEII